MTDSTVAQVIKLDEYRAARRTHVAPAAPAPADVADVIDLDARRRALARSLAERQRAIEAATVRVDADDAFARGRALSALVRSMLPHAVAVVDALTESA